MGEAGRANSVADQEGKGTLEMDMSYGYPIINLVFQSGF